MKVAEKRERRSGRPLVLIFLLLAAGIVSAGYSYYRTYEQQFRSGVEHELSAVTELQVAQIVQWRRERLTDANYLQHTPYAARRSLDVLAQPASASTRKTFTSWLDSLLAGGSYEQVLLLDDQLKLGLAYPGRTPAALSDVALRAAQQALSLQQVVVADLHRETEDGPVYLSIMVPLVVRRESTGDKVPAAGTGSLPGDRSAALLILQINANTEFYPLIQHWPTPSRTAETLLVRRDGNDALFLNELKSQTNTALKFRIPLERTNVIAVKAALGLEGIVEGSDHRGVPVVAAMRAIPDSPWSMACRMDLAEVYAPVRKRLWEVVVLIGILLFGAGAGVGLVWRQQRLRFYEERHTAAAALQEKTALLEAQVNSSMDGILVVDQEGRKLLQNQRLADLLKIPQHIADDQDDEKQVLWLRSMTKNPELFTQKFVHLFSHPEEISRDEIELKDGTVLDRYSSPVIGKDGKYHGRIWTFRDITERKRAEAKLARTEELYRRAIAGAGAVPYSSDYETKSYLFMGEGIEQLIGYAPHEVTGQLWKEIIQESVMGGETAGLTKEEAARRMASGEIRTWRCDMRIRTRDGKSRWLSDASVQNLDESGQPTGSMGILQDITERKQAEISALAFSELGQRLSSATSARGAFGIINEVSKGLFGWDAFCIRLYSAKSDSIYSGFMIDTINGQPVVEEQSEPVKPGDLYRRIIERGGELILRDQPMTDVPGITPFGDASRPSVALMFVPIRSHGQVVGILSVQSYTPHAYNERDLNTLQTVADQCGGAIERIWADEALRESKDRYRLLVEESPDTIGIYQAGKLVFINSVGTRQLGATTPEELLGRKTEQIIHPDDLAGAADRIRRRMAGETGMYPAEVRYLRLDGTTVPVEVSAAPITFEGKPAMQFIARDITARKQAEESLRLLGSAVLQSKEAILITDAELDLPGPKIIFVNPAFTQMTGYTAWEAIGKTPRILQGPRTDKTVLSRLRQNLERGEVFEGEAINYRKDGTEFILEWQVAPIRDADGKITHFVAIERDITARKQTENALRESNDKFHQLADHITDAFWIRSPDLREVHYVSPAFERIWGRSVESLYANPQSWADFILPEDRERVLNAFAALTGDAPSLDIEYRIVRPNGEIRWVRVRGFQVRDAARKLIRQIGIVGDITERKRVEAQLFQSQKMETVGKLAGGVAHEFNSILTAIIGQSELLLGDLPAGSSPAKSAAGIHKAAERAATLTRQLLAYGRRTFLRPELLDLSRVIGSMEDTIRHLLGGAVDVRIVPAAGLHAVKADAGQIEQVIMNLVMNAADAMPNGGKLTLETGNVSFDQESVGRYPELKPGDYVTLTITDTGTGMSAEVQARAFEPFFTTKGVGQGTGLGLSTCYGIIKQSGGHISVYTELGRGTAFKICLPQVEPHAKIPLQRLDSPDLPRGTETILLAEDDPALREMAAALLKRLGYTVLAAANGVEALRLNQQRDAGPVDLLFTDVVMPHMSGKELAERVRASHPHTRILFTSAYTENAIVHQGVLNPGVALLQKPFTPSALARKVREVLDQPEAPKPDPAQKTPGFTNSTEDAKPPGS